MINNNQLKAKLDAGKSDTQTHSRKRLFSQVDTSYLTPSKTTLTTMFASSPKYGVKSLIQKER